VAVYSWIADLPEPSLQDSLVRHLITLGLQIQPEFCSAYQLYAEDPSDAHLPLSARVKVLASRTSACSGEWHVEVRSAEPMVRRQTRCQQVAQQLQALIPS
jgi:hypothetical protein